MKKSLIPIILIVLSVAVLCVPCFAVAAAEQGNIHLINPQAIAVDGDFLYVVDSVTDSESVLLSFNVKEQPVYTASYAMDYVVSQIVCNDGNLYAITDEKVLKFTLADGKPLFNEEYRLKAVDLDVLDGVLVYVNDGGLYDQTRPDPITSEALQKAKSCCVYDGKIYFLYEIVENGEAKDQFRYYDGRFSDKITPTVRVNSLVDMGDKLAMFDNNTFYETASPFNPIFQISGSDLRIVDAVYLDGNLYVLNSENKILRYKQDADSFYVDETFSIGSDTVEIAPPSFDEFNSFTLAQASGYPANIIYKTTDDDFSVEKLIDDYNGKQYVVIGYENENTEYYYVFANGKFGWVKKSNADVEQDDKLVVVKTTLSNKVTFRAQLMSINTQIYYLPYGDDAFRKEVVSRSADNLASVELLQQFVDGDGNTWYYVNYDGKFGFVNKNDVGKYYADGVHEGVEIVGDRKINSSLFNAVSVYLTAELNDKDVIGSYDKDGNYSQLKLYSGKFVKVIEETENASYIQIIEDDGTYSYGWVASKYIIGEHSLTTNAAVGIVLMCVALTIGITVITILMNRRKNLAQGKFLDDEG